MDKALVLLLCLGLTGAFENQCHINNEICVKNGPYVQHRDGIQKRSSGLSKKCVPVDIILVFDESGSIGSDNFETMKTFGKDLIGKFTIGPDHAQFSLITYSADSVLQFQLNEYGSASSIISAIENAIYRGGGTNTADALALARQSMTSTYGKRDNALSLAIVLTDGVSNVPADTVNEATNLHNAGLTVFCIGIGSNLDMDELKAIASNPNDDYLIMSSDFDELTSKIEQLVNSLCINDIAPSFETCMMEIQDSHGEKAQSQHVGTSACQNQQHFYGKYQVLYAHTIMKIASDGSQQTWPQGSQDFKYGITDAQVNLIRKSMDGTESKLTEEIVKTDPSTSTAPPSELDAERNLTNTYNLSNGERVCLRYKAWAGGYVQYNNKRYVYTKTHSQHDLCYYFDSVAPKHCKDTSSCSQEPVSLSKQVTKDRRIDAFFSNWMDPFPTGYTSEFASGLKSFELYLHEMRESLPGRLEMNPASTLQLQCASCSTFAVDLPASTSSKFYAAVLEVVDNALNYRQARRFVLYDDTSEIKIHESYRLKVTSASSETNFIWQVNHGNLCYSWKDRYYNDEFIHFNPLNPIDQDHHGHISGVYEETNGLFPINGTKNVHGITSFRYTLMRESSVIQYNQSIADVTSESLCLDPSVTSSLDGQTFLLYLYSYDISSNSLADNVTVYFDASPPEISDMWLTKNGHQQLFVHDMTDLSTMQLMFKAFDTHCGLHSVEWFVGTVDDGTHIGHGAIGVIRLPEKMSCPASSTSCYCPSIGVCLYNNFTISLQSMIANDTHIGNHNRKYFFEIKVTNVALLASTERVDVLVDDSPPEVGVVLEGPVGGRDVDYSQDKSIVIRWSSFIDHESGVKYYDIGVSNSCLTIQNFTLAEYQLQKNGVESEARFNIVEAGKYFSTVIAYNNAAEGSGPVCSDGFTIDESPPVISNVSLQNAITPKSFACYNNEMWYVDENARKIQVDNSHPCYHSCSGKVSVDLLQYMPHLSINFTVPNYTCAIERSNAEMRLYIPSDKIHLRWNLTDGESQIEEAFVGFGSDKGMAANPDLVGYVKAEHFEHYRKHHSGFNTGTALYIFIKAKNKAGLESIAIYGPVTIDEDHPTCSRSPDIVLGGTDVSVVWNASILYDDEQGEDIGYMYYRIGNGHYYVTDFTKWDIAEPPQTCSSHSSYCIKYPMRTLQMLAAESDLTFHFNMQVYSYAGHYCSVNSSEFKLPSTHPPSLGVVHEVSKQVEISSARQNDIDYVSTSGGGFCVTWYGFEHREDIKFEVGIGTSQHSPDVMPFHTISSGNKFCYDAINLDPYVEYFSIVNASNSAGYSIVSSDGFIVVAELDYLDGLTVYDGVGCNQTKKEASLILGHTVSNGTDYTLNLATQLHVGEVYTLQIRCNSTDLEINSDDILQESVTSNENSIIVTFMSMKHEPIIRLKSMSSSVHVSEATLQRCIEDLDEIYLLEKVQAHWTINASLAKHVSFYEFSLIESCQGVDCPKTVLPFTSVGKDDYTTLNLMTLREGHHTFLVRPCFDSFCFNSSASDGFFFEKSAPLTRTLAAMLDVDANSCDNLDISFDRFDCPGPSQHPILYRWSVIEKRPKNKTLTTDYVTKPSQSSVIKDTRCVELPIYPHAPLEVCVEGYCTSGNHGTTCAQMRVKQHPNTFSKTIVYDLNEASALALSIENYRYSLNIGDKLNDLNEQEMDFHRSGVTACGFLVGTGDQGIMWYLMKNPKVPTSDCDDDVECVLSKETRGGFVSFKYMTLTDDTIYYICASSKTSQSSQSTINSCSDGFLIDDTKPTAGSVEVESGCSSFIRNGNEMTVKWSGFTDSSKYQQLGYRSEIANYSVAVGSYPGGEDVQRYTPVGSSETTILTSLGLDNGYTYYASVKAFDHNGQSIIATSGGYAFDSTQPESGRIFIGSFNSHQSISNDEVLSVHLRDFADLESGINKIELGIGSSTTNADVVPFFQVYGGLAEITQTSNFHDGHRYYAIALITNNAGLVSRSVSKVFIFDRTPPTGGSVRDGPEENQHDINYQTNTSHLECHWTGFSDAHSGIGYFKIGLGKSPFNTDERSLVNVGLRSAWVWRHSLIPGVKYYVTLMACNGADLCTTKSSNGVISDSSPPIPGRVHVGLTGSHSKYVSHRSFLMAEWFAFEDPESGVESYEACIGTSPQVCDVTSFKYCSKKLMTTFTGLILPTATNLFVTVKARNKAGLSMNLSSDAFQVDNSAPQVVIAPTFNVSGMSLYRNTQWDLSLVKLFWHFNDDESSVLKHYVSITSHQTGHVNIGSVELTSERNWTFSLSNEKWLRPGDTYYATVTACNAADLCTTSTSSGLLVDSTPPQLGGFMPDLRWSNDNMTANLTWYGFSDEDSGILSYRIAIGSTYSGRELTDGQSTINHVGDKNDVQSSTVNISRQLVNGEKLFLSVSAENGVGLRSKAIMKTVEVVSTDVFHSVGVLVIEKHSCDVEYCNSDCTCAVLGSKCVEIIHNMTCIEVQQTSSSTSAIDLQMGLANEHEQHSASTACLTAKWNNENQISGRQVTRFEWSFGILNMPFGAGVFNIDEPVWHDIGKDNYVVHCLPRDRLLLHDHRYVAYLKVWFSETDYTIFTSPSILIDTSPPMVNRGKFIMDSSGLCDRDLEFVHSSETFTACWSGVFSDHQSGIMGYRVFVGTYPRGDDVVDVTDVGLDTDRQFTGLSLAAGTRYYVTVEAFNLLGLTTMHSSDGFMVDNQKPQGGVVYNTNHFHDVEFRTDTTYVGISWNGFSDEQSYIKSYKVAVAQSEASINQSAITFENANFNNTFNFNNLNLQHDTSYVALVKGVDAAGFESDIILSPSFSIDSTPPVGIVCNSYEELSAESRQPNETSFSWELTAEFVGGDYYKLEIHMISLVLESALSVVIGPISQILPMNVDSEGNSSTEIKFFSQLSGFKNIKLAGNLLSADSGEMSMKLSRCTSQKESMTDVFTLQQIEASVISGSLHVLDSESGIQDILIGAGTTEHGFQIQALESVQSDHFTINAKIPHGTPVFVKALVVNHAGLRSQFPAPPLIIDHTGPQMSALSANAQYKEVNDTHVTSLHLAWTAEDKESGIKLCKCAFGTVKGSDNLQQWTSSKTFNSCTSSQMHLEHGVVVYPSVKCINNVNLVERVDLEGTVVSFRAPDERASILRFAANSVSLDSTTQVQRFKSSLHLYWDYFTDRSSMNKYQCRIKSKTGVVMDWQDVGQHNYLSAEGVTLADGEIYLAELEGQNVGDVWSQAINATITIEDVVPVLTGNFCRLLNSTEEDKTVVSWEDIFRLDERLQPSFLLVIGSKEGHSDIVRSLHTSHKTATIKKKTGVTDLFVVISAKYVTGAQTVYRENLRMDK